MLCSVGVTLLRVCPFVLMASKSEVLRRASTSESTFRCSQTSPQQLGCCVFFPPAFFLYFPSGAAVFSIVSFRGFHLCAGCRKTHNFHYTLYWPLQVFDPIYSLQIPRIKYAGRNWNGFSWYVNYWPVRFKMYWRMTIQKKTQKWGFDQWIFGVFLFFKEAIQM